MKIAETVDEHRKELQSEKVNIADSFLSSLSKPKNQKTKEAELKFDEKILFKPKEKVAKKVELTE